MGIDRVQGGIDSLNLAESQPAVTGQFGDKKVEHYQNVSTLSSNEPIYETIPNTKLTDRRVAIERFFERGKNSINQNKMALSISDDSSAESIDDLGLESHESQNKMALSISDDSSAESIDDLGLESHESMLSIDQEAKLDKAQDVSNNEIDKAGIKSLVKLGLKQAFSWAAKFASNHKAAIGLVLTIGAIALMASPAGPALLFGSAIAASLVTSIAAAGASACIGAMIAEGLGSDWSTPSSLPAKSSNEEASVADKIKDNEAKKSSNKAVTETEPQIDEDIHDDVMMDGTIHNLYENIKQDINDNGLGDGLDKDLDDEFDYFDDDEFDDDFDDVFTEHIHAEPKKHPIYENISNEFVNILTDGAVDNEEAEQKVLDVFEHEVNNIEQVASLVSLLQNNKKFPIEKNVVLHNALGKLIDNHKNDKDRWASVLSNYDLNNRMRNGFEELENSNSLSSTVSKQRMIKEFESIVNDVSKERWDNGLKESYMTTVVFEVLNSVGKILLEEPRVNISRNSVDQVLDSDQINNILDTFKVSDNERKTIKDIIFSHLK